MKSSLFRNTRDAFGEALTELGASNPKLIVLDTDVNDSTRTQSFSQKYKARFFNLGISEQDMIGTAVGLAMSGHTVFSSTFAVFLSRCLDQIRYTLAYHNADVKLVGTHSGIGFGEDGASAHSINDLAMMRSVPNFTLIASCDFVSTKKVIKHACNTRGPFYVRLLRQETPVIYEAEDDFQIEKANTLMDGSDATILAHGAMVIEALKASEILDHEGYKIRVVDMHLLKPLDTSTVLEAAKETGRILCVEDHSVIGGLGSAVTEFLSESYPVPIKRLGVADKFASSGNFSDLYNAHGLSGPKIAQKVKNLVRNL